MGRPELSSIRPQESRAQSRFPLACTSHVPRMYLACTSQSPPNYLACTWLGRLVTNHSWLSLALGPFPDFSVSAFARLRSLLSTFCFPPLPFHHSAFCILHSAFNERHPGLPAPVFHSPASLSHRWHFWLTPPWRPNYEFDRPNVKRDDQTARNANEQP